MNKDYWTCSRCGLELDRRNQWEMIQVDSHLDKHRYQDYQLELNSINKEAK